MLVKFKSVMAFRSEDTKFPAANLIRGGGWISESKSRCSVNDIVLLLDTKCVINAIQIGNWGSSFISVEVSRIDLQKYQTLLPSTELISARDALSRKNWFCVHTFSTEHFTSGVREQKWNLLRITCMQPFLYDDQFGLLYFKAFSIPEKETPAPTLESPPPGSSFAMMRNLIMAKNKPVVVLNRSEQLLLAAKEKQNPHREVNFAEKPTNSTLKSHFHNEDNSVNKKSCSEVDASGKISKIYSSHRLSVSPKTKDLAMASDKVLADVRIIQSTDVDFSLPCSSASPANFQQNSQNHSINKPEVITRNARRRIIPPKYVSSENSLKEKTRKKKKHLNPCLNSGSKTKTRVKSKHGNRGRSESNIIEISDSDSDQQQRSEVDILDISDSDISDTTTVVFRPQSVDKRRNPSDLSPSRLVRDFDSDTETIIFPIKEPTPKSQKMGENVPKNYKRLAKSSNTATQGNSDIRYTKVSCPLCSGKFDAASIEQHAASCCLVPEPAECVCPICQKIMPLDVLPHHADLCAAIYKEGS